MKFYLLRLLTLVLALVATTAQAQLLQWNTFGNLGTETTEPSIANDPNLSAANLTLGPGVTAAGNTNRFGGTGWFDTGNTNPNTLVQAVAGDNYIQFIVTPNTGFSFTPTSFVFRWDRSGTGPSSVTLRSSADGFTVDLGTLTGLTSGGTSTTTDRTITITGLTNLTTATTFRIYGYGATATTGTGGFDASATGVNVQLNGTTTGGGPTNPAPTASLTTAPNVVTSGGGTYQFTVTHADNTNVNFSTIDNNDIRVTGPGSFDQAATLVSTSPSANAASIAATYQITPPGGTWDATDNGTYNVVMQASQVSDDNATPAFVAPGNIGAGFNVSITVGIHAVQGSGSSSPLINTTQTIRGIVTGDFQGSLRLGGFYVQEEDADADADPNTSEGIFVFQGSSTTPNVNVGDLVQVTGTVIEFNTLTEITSPTITVIGSGNSLPTVTSLTLPFASATDRVEAVEGMLVTFTQPLTVTGNDNHGELGLIALAQGGRLLNPTQIAAPGAVANAQASDNLRRLLFLDDGASGTGTDRPNPIPYINTNTSSITRVGDQISGLTGIMDYGVINLSPTLRDYRLQPTGSVTVTSANPRPALPTVGSTANIRATAFNVLNYFNGDGSGGGFPTSRGANTLAEFNRQRAKIISALQTINADVVGLIEMENDGEGANSAVQDLVNGLNTALGAGTYVSAPNPNPGTDQIKVAIIYKPSRLSLVPGGAFSSLDPVFDRPPFAQTFAVGNNGDKFTFIVNHFKSKSCGGASGADADQLDGQGCFNARRLAQANALRALVTNTIVPSVNDTDVLIVGDLNAYTQENPIANFTSNGYVDEITRYNGNSPQHFSFNFDNLSGSLDHALSSVSMSAKITGAKKWNINADEPQVIDYNQENKAASPPAGFGTSPDLYQPDAFRSSDHDALVVGIRFPNVWTGTAWSAGVQPTATDDAVIAGPYPNGVASEGSFTTGNLTINSGVNMQIGSGFNVTVNGTLTYTGNVTVQSGGALIQGVGSTLGTTSGTFSALRDLTKPGPGYNFIASPVIGATFNSIGTTPYPTARYRHDPAQGPGARWIAMTGTDGLTPSMGYTFISNTGSSTLTFTGVPNNGNGNLALTGQTGYRFNLVGNPYPSPLNLTQLFNDNNNATTGISGSAWFWQDNNNNTGTGSYVVSNGVTPNTQVAVGQGFFVQANSNSGTLTFTNGQRGLGNPNFYRSEGSDMERFRLGVNSSHGADELWVAFAPQFTTGYERGYDAEKLEGATNLSLSAIMKNERLAIAALPETNGQKLELPLALFARHAGSYTFAPKEVESATAQKLFLEDRQTGEFYYLQTGKSHTINLQAGNYRDRFFLRSANEVVGQTARTGDYASAYTFGRELFVSADGAAQVVVYNLLGTEVQRFASATGQFRAAVAVPSAGVYIVKVATAAGTVEKRVWLEK